MEVIKARPSIHVNFIGTGPVVEILIHRDRIWIPLEFVPDVAAAMQKLFDEIHGD